jgi:hypothetical protein
MDSNTEFVLIGSLDVVVKVGIGIGFFVMGIHVFFGLRDMFELFILFILHFFLYGGDVTLTLYPVIG